MKKIFKHDFAWIFTGVLACWLSLVVLPGCMFFRTITPKPIVAEDASFDDGVKNSGFLFFMPDKSGCITEGARERYNALIKIYGKDFLIPLDKDAGIKVGPVIDKKQTYLIDPEHLVKFGQMNQWRKEGRKPGNRPPKFLI